MNYYIGLGSNLGFRHDQMLQAIHEIRTHIDPHARISSIYSSPPFGFSGKNPFLNAVIQAKTSLSPTHLLHFLKNTEKKIHPQNKKRSGNNYCDRYIDLDILLYDGPPIESEHLTIPHPRLQERDFVLLPLLELNPHLQDPRNHLPLKTWLQKIPDKEKKTTLWKKNTQKLISIEGNIGAGKTTLVKRIRCPGQRIKKIYENFRENPWLEKFYSQPQRFALRNELWFARQRYNQWKNIFPNPFSLILSDYFCQKTFLFASLNLKASEQKIFSRKTSPFLFSLPQPDLIIYIHAPTDILLRQISHRARKSELSISVKYLEQIHEKYQTYFHQHPHIPVISVTNKQINDIQAIISNL